MRKTLALGLLPFYALLLAACAASHPSQRTWAEAAEAPGCEEPDEDQCVVLACYAGMCGFFLCEDVVPAEVPPTRLKPGVELVRNGGTIAPPMGPAQPRRWWGRALGLPGSAEPVLTFRWYPQAPPVRPVYALPPGRYVRHHIFPQAPDLALYFKRSGIDIHRYTLLIPEHLHIRIHRGGPRGGLWNEAWREFAEANPTPPPPAIIYRHAGELIFRFELTGPVVPYYRR